MKGRSWRFFESNDWDRFKPQIILVETHFLDLEELDRSDVIHLLSRLNYKLICQKQHDFYFFLWIRRIGCTKISSPASDVRCLMSSDFEDPVWGNNGLITSGRFDQWSGISYPIIRGIRFAKSEAYSKSFGYEWNKWPRVQFESENKGKPMQGHTTAMWNKITRIGGRPYC